MEESKIKGFRKIGIAMGAITAVSVADSVDFKIAVIIGTIAVVGIVCQCILDRRKHE